MLIRAKKRVFVAMSHFCVSFASSDDKRPYDDWVAKYKPRCAAFVYNNEWLNCDEVLRLRYLPNESVVHVIYFDEYYNMEAIVYINIDTNAKQVNIVNASCECNNYWTMGNEEEHEKGGLEVFTRNMSRFIDDIVLKYIAKHMFGIGWTTVIMAEAEDTTDIVERVNYYRELIPYGPWRKTIGVYDVSVQRVGGSQKVSL